MIATRRRFFQALSAAPLVAKQAAETAARGLMGGGGPPMGGGYLRDVLGGQIEGLPANSASPPNWHLMRKLRDEMVQKALNTKKSRAELESIIYEEQRHIWTLDHDLAANRSMSLAAKITFQRQRNVQRSIREAIEEKSAYSRMMEWKDRFISMTGIKL